MKLVFDGILMIKDPSFYQIAQRFSLPERAIRLDKTKHHITLIDWRLLEPYKDLINKGFVFQPLPKVSFERKIWYRTNPAKGKESWAIKVDSKTQKELSKWVKQTSKQLGLSVIEPREFHLSIANLTGGPRDSVR